MLAALAASALVVAMGSPWWEDYAIKETYLCSGQGQVVLERNDAQASLNTGRYRTTLFRQQDANPSQDSIMGIVYRNDLLTLILRGDQLILEQLPQRTSCMRTESV
ncbi:MAG: hypothetical protein FJ078_04730 [Cyanobacteria bacterium K_DeepCast_35m_m2_155]|nr:hypothetical protein [Cyanobacteria bacterium K_DeepCast_35m_m2_155]